MQVLLVKRKRPQFDWKPVEELIRLLYEEGLSPRAIQKSLADQGFGDYPWRNVNTFLGRFRKSPSRKLRDESIQKFSIDGRLRIRAPWLPFRQVICDGCGQEFSALTWNNRLCSGCTKTASIREINRLKRYGITPTDFQRMWQLQGGKCGICGLELKLAESASERMNPENPRIDHCHKTGIIRGLLCNPCNRFLGPAEMNGWINRRLEGKKFQGFWGHR